jgi:hypothetical protein
VGYFCSTCNKTTERVFFQSCIVIQPDVSIEAAGERFRKGFAHPSIPEQGAISLQKTNLRKAQLNRLASSVATAVIDQVDSYIQIFNIFLTEKGVQRFEGRLFPIETGH